MQNDRAGDRIISPWLAEKRPSDVSPPQRAADVPRFERKGTWTFLLLFVLKLIGAMLVEVCILVSCTCEVTILKWNLYCKLIWQLVHVLSIKKRKIFIAMS